ncbi:MAG: carboxylate-amine ligase, partial [Bacteroidota bacterium]
MSSQNLESNIPSPGSEEEILQFKKIQAGFSKQFENVFPDKLAPRTVIIVPSLTMDQEILSKIVGFINYEERLLCMLMLLRMPRTHLVYLTSIPIDPIIVDYYLHQLPGITGYHAQRRLTLLSCHDASGKSLTEKIMQRPRLIQRIRECIADVNNAHMACFNVTEFERSLAVQLGVPIFGCDPDLYELGSKSNGRKIFRECGVPVPPGFEDLRTEEDIVEALVKLKQQDPGLRKVVLKLNDGFSGDGNGVFDYTGIEEHKDWKQWVHEQLPRRLRLVAEDLSYEKFLQKYNEMGGIIEAFIEGEIKESPSVQCRITPAGVCEVISTHDQVLGGESGQVFIGAKFPASIEYAPDLNIIGKKVS